MEIDEESSFRISTLTTTTKEISRVTDMIKPITPCLIIYLQRGSSTGVLVVSSSSSPSLLRWYQLRSSMLSLIYDLLNRVKALVQSTSLLQRSKTMIEFSKAKSLDIAGHISVLQPHLQWGFSTPTSMANREYSPHLPQASPSRL